MNHCSTVQILNLQHRNLNCPSLRRQPLGSVQCLEAHNTQVSLLVALYCNWSHWAINSAPLNSDFMSDYTNTTDLLSPPTRSTYLNARVQTRDEQSLLSCQVQTLGWASELSAGKEDESWRPSNSSSSRKRIQRRTTYLSENYVTLTLKVGHWKTMLWFSNSTLVCRGVLLCLMQCWASYLATVSGVWDSQNVDLAQSGLRLLESEVINYL